MVRTFAKSCFPFPPPSVQKRATACGGHVVTMCYFTMHSSPHEYPLLVPFPVEWSPPSLTPTPIALNSPSPPLHCRGRGITGWRRGARPDGERECQRHLVHTHTRGGATTRLGHTTGSHQWRGG
eukprot:Sspe_Gene.27299::Locus_11688_Transcript_1_1_Confidence_1.000_Length_2229::g.27299::m.27299